MPKPSRWDDRRSLHMMSDTSTYLVAVQTRPVWLVGETEHEAFARRIQGGLLCDREREDHYGNDYAGRAVWVRDAELPHDPVDGDLYDVVSLDLSSDDLEGLRARRYKVPPGLAAVADVTFADRYGAIAQELQRLFPGATTATEEDEQARIETVMERNDLAWLAWKAELREWKKRYAKAVVGVPLPSAEPFTEPKPQRPTPEAVPEPDFSLEVVRLWRRLPKTEAHTGTGLYATKASPAHNDDTQSGPPAGQVVTLTTGGLGTTSAWAGGYVYNATRSQTRAIVSHNDDDVTLEGDLSSWADGDDLDIYDAWSTAQGPCDQLWTDQGSTTFTAHQYIRIFAGTYNENVVANPALDPDTINGFGLIIEGDPSDDRDNIVIAPVGGNAAVEANCDHCHLRHLKVAGTPANYSVIFHSGNQLSEISDCHIDAGKYLYLYYGCFVRDCDIVSAGSYALRIGSGRVRRCRLSVPGGTAIQATAAVVVEGCTFDDCNVGVTQYYGRAPVRVANCTFYDCAWGMYVREALGPCPVVINNIFKDVDYPYYVNKWPEETATGYGPIFVQRNNCYHGYIAYAYDGSDTKTAAEWAAFNQVDVSGELDATDPLLADPDNDDFSLAADSPCRHAGHGSGVVYDVDGNPFDLYHPDIGAVSTGVGPNVVYSS